MFAALTGRSPVGNRYRAGIDEPTTKLLRTVAREMVQEYYSKEGIWKSKEAARRTSASLIA